jgi:NAD-dependent dihydropyrimidine dehydrogenase PreA subunit
MNFFKIALLVMRLTKMIVQIKVDYDRCTGCKECVKACSYGVLEWFEDMPIIVNPSSCAVCLECKKSCPVNAISVKEK